MWQHFVTRNYLELECLVIWDQIIMDYVRGGG